MSLILDFIFPKYCYSCGQKGDYFCQKCSQKIHIKNIKSPQNGFDGGLSLFKYQNSIKSAIIDLKYAFIYDNAQSLSNLMARKIKKNFPNLIHYWQQNNFIIIPIPLHKFRLNWRGFNQSEILAQNISQKLNLNFSNEILIRHKNNSIQARIKNPSNRKDNVENIFSLSSNAQKYQNQNFIIFDDVTTSQSTLISAQKILKTLSQNPSWFLTLSEG